MVDFNKLKKSSGSNLEKLSKAVEAMASPANSGDDKYWKPELDKSGNYYGVIRFLPVAPVDGDDGEPWVRYYDHGFQGPGGWYIEKSLTSIGLQDDVSEYNTKLWQSGIEANKELARKQKRRLHYVSNIYVVKDSKHPEKEGQVFLFKYGKKIFERLTQAMKPEFEDETPIDPFDLWSGANFLLKIRKVDGQWNYDLCKFDSPAPLLDDDAELEKIWKSEHSLKEILDPKNFKTREELKKRLDRVLGNTPVPTPSPVSVESNKKKPEFVDTISDEDDEDLSYFSKLVEDD